MKIDFKEELSKYENQMESVKKEYNLISWIRIFTALIIISLLIGFMFTQNIFLLVATIISVIIFIIVAIIHAKCDSKYYLAKYKCEATNRYLSRQSNAWRDFFDTGIEFEKKDAYVAADLDLFGKGSLFQYINVCRTPYGRLQLKNSLQNGCSDLASRQVATEELAQKFSCAINLESSFMMFKRKNNASNAAVDGITKFTKRPFQLKKINLIISIFFVILTILLITLAIIGLIPLSAVILVIAANLFITYMIGKSRIEHIIGLQQAARTLIGYDEIVAAILAENFTSPKLKQIQKVLENESQKGIKQFSRIVDFVSSRKNIFFLLIADGLLQIDTFIFYAYAKWQEKYGALVENWIQAIAEIEELLSLAVVGIVKETSTVPKISKDIQISFKDLKHPLINEASAIGNSFETKANMNVITGSNMSGKTTFLRTIGINMCLFMAGGLVNAREFTASIMKIFTSMRVQDDTLLGISTFYAEINRVKMMIEYQKTNCPMLVLIDEIFKGTNSNDRIVGARSAIEKLSAASTIGIVSTHDLELCTIENITNYHFMEYYKEEKILFDYLLRTGISKTKNAKYLMKMVGIID